MNLDPLRKAIQRLVGVDDDGVIGPATLKAIYKKLSGKDWGALPSPALPGIPEPENTDKADERSEKNIASMLPEVRPYFRALCHAAKKHGLDARVISGTRSYDEQNALYAKGRTSPGRIVTNARAGHSNHNFGIAGDFGLFDGGKYLDGEASEGRFPAAKLDAMYSALGALGREIGLEWGGDWSSFKDLPHFQFRPAWARGMSESAMLAEMRSRKSAGKSLIA